MDYLKVKWIHCFDSEPVLLYSEMDELRWEVRKVEEFADGHFGFASKERSFGSTYLGKVPIPALSEISSDPQFEPAVITKMEFEEVWARATSAPHSV